jgi:hypothetical protein
MEETSSRILGKLQSSHPLTTVTPSFINKIGERGHFQLGRARRNSLKGIEDSNRTYTLTCAFHSSLQIQWQSRTSISDREQASGSFDAKLWPIVSRLIRSGDLSHDILGQQWSSLDDDHLSHRVTAVQDRPLSGDHGTYQCNNPSRLRAPLLSLLLRRLCDTANCHGCINSKSGILQSSAHCVHTQ